MIEEEGFKKLEEPWSPVGWTVIGDLGYNVLNSFCYLANPNSWLVEFKIGIMGRYVFIDTISDIIDIEDIMELVKEEMHNYTLQEDMINEISKRLLNIDLYSKNNYQYYDSDTTTGVLNSGICSGQNTIRTIPRHEEYSGIFTCSDANWNSTINVQGNTSTAFYSQNV